MKLPVTLSAVLLLGAIALPLAASAADSAETLIKSNGCTACHSTDTKLVGPSYKDVAAKYKGDKEAETKMIAKVKAGGSGVWGPVPMPPHPTISDADLKTMVDWVLALK